MAVRRARTPIWLLPPTRFAGLGRREARIVAGVIAVLLLACLAALASAGPPVAHHDAIQSAGGDRADVMLYASIVDGVRHGGDYYTVAASALRAGGYPLRPFVTFRLPTLAIVQAALPPFASVVLLYLLAAAVLLAWHKRLRPVLRPGPPIVIALVLLAAGMVVFVQRDLVPFHEAWAGPLVALSLALRRPGRWVEAVAVGLIAMLVRETAALFVIIMALFALIEGERREAIGWGVALAVFAVVVAVHAQAVAAVVGPLDPASPGWSGMLGPGFVVNALAASTALMLAPGFVGVLLVGLALFGWVAWRDPLALRVVAVFVAYGLLIAIAGRVDTFYWAMMVAPLLLLGLAFVPDGIADLWRALLDRRRITVTRISR